MNKVLIFISIFLFSSGNVFSQITGNGATTTQPTSYTDGSPNDVIYIYCIPPGGNASQGSLTANSPTGAGSFTFTWFQYNSASNSLSPYTTDVGVNTSTINNLSSGGYFVSITDNSNNNVGCFMAWVFNNETNLDAGTINTNCGGFNLNGIADPVADFVYYNPPPLPMIIDANTQITVCFDATHTYVSDIGFFLVSPSGTTITLAPNPQAINAGNGCCCNSGNNVNNLCFTTVPSGGLFVCGFGSPLTGTFSAYENTSIDWSPIYGQDAAQGGWSVQIYDCIGGDVGALTHASISFSGNSACGPQNIVYDSGNINSTINDNSCSAASASIYTVPQQPSVTTPIVLANTLTYQWSDDNPCLTVPNATTSLTPAIPATPTQDTWFYLQATDNFGCTFTDSVLFTRNCPCATNSPFTSLTANLTAPDCANTGTFDINGQVQFNGNIPCTGTLTISTCSGATQVFNAPFVSPINYSLTGIAADGTPNCDVSATFSNDPEQCVITTNVFTEPICPCNITVFNANIGSCFNNNYDINGDITFTIPPGLGGFLTISVTNGSGTTFDTIINSADYNSPMTWSISNIPADGSNSVVSATFSNDATCTSSINYPAPAACGCSAQIGTFTQNMNGSSNTNYVLCFGDQFTYQSNGDYTPPDNINDGSLYDPGLAYLLYSCPPTPNTEPPNDACFIGLLNSGAGNVAFNDLNDLSLINSYPSGTFTNNTIFVVPITMYDVTNNIYSNVVVPNPSCFDLGPTIAVQYLPETKSIEVEDCQAGSITSTINGGLPAIDPNEVFTVVPGSLSPANASFFNTTCSDGGTITITGLNNNQNYSFDVIDGNGCPLTISGLFIGTEDPGFSYNNYNICTNGTDPVVNITGDPGTFSYIATSGGPTLSLNTNTGAIDVSTSNPGVYDVTFLTNDPTCFSDSTVTITILETPTVNPVLDQTVCHGTDFTAINFSGTPLNGVTYDWTNTNTSIGLAANGTGSIAVFTASNTTSSPITGTITVTPTLGTCVGTSTNFNLIVNPIDDPSFQYDGGLTYCATGLVDPTVTITGLAGGTFSYIVNSGGPNLVLNANNGTVDLSASNVGSYAITYQTQGNCPDSTSLDLTITNAPIADFTFDEYCLNATDPLPNYINGGSGGNFTSTAGLVINNANGLIDLSASTPGTYTVTNTIDQTVQGCVLATYQDDIIIYGLPTVTPINDTTICSYETLQSINVNVNGTSPTWTIIYEYNGAPQPYIASQNLPLPIPYQGFGTYEIVSVADQYCTNIISEIINVNSYPVVLVDSINDYDVCEGKQLSINNFTGQPIGNTYAWNLTSGSDIGFGTSGNGNIGNFTGINPQTSTVEVVATSNNINGNCVSNPITFDVTVNPNPIVNFTALDTAGCEPLQVEFNNNSTETFNCEWNFSDGTQLQSCGTTSYSFDAGVYDVQLIVTSAFGCSDSISKINYINVTPIPIADFAYSPQVTDINHTEIEFINSSIDADSYIWDFGDESPYSNEIDPAHNYSDVPNDYVITLIASNNNGLCIDTAVATLIVNDILIYYVPNVFTPDNDEYNQTFKPVFTSGYDPYDYHLMIFNRWGELVFESYNSAIGWDGTYPKDGVLCEDGVYVWKIDFKDVESDKRYHLNGHVTLLK
jgi:gliding motility-associated-like protein